MRRNGGLTRHRLTRHHGAPRRISGVVTKVGSRGDGRTRHEQDPGPGAEPGSVEPAEPSAAVPDDEEAFQRSVREAARRRLEGASLLCLLAFVIGWIVGRIVLRGHALEGEGRFYLAVLGGLAVISWVAFRYVLTRWRIVDPVALGFFAQNAVAMVAALHVGAMGSLESPFFFTIYTLPSLQIGIPMRLRWRLAYAVSGSLTWAGVIFGLHPEYLDYPMLHAPVVCLLGITAASVTLGHMSYNQVRETFMLGRQLARKQLELESYTSALEKEVDQRSEAMASLSRQLAHTSVNRQGLARALHDDLGQLIVAVRMELDLLERTASRVRKGQQLEHMGAVLQTLDGSVRRFIERLRSPAPVGSLREEVETLVEPLRHRYEVATSIDDALSLTESEQELVYRFLQEAITNVVKHADAESVEVVVTYDTEKESVSARVADDGMGFANTAKSGWGLRGMRERAAAASGAIDVTTGDEGTRVRLTFPRRDRASA